MIDLKANNAILNQSIRVGLCLRRSCWVRWVRRLHEI